MNKRFMSKGLDQRELSAARCDLNNLADCTSKGLAIGISHNGGDSRYSVVTIHKVANDKSYSVKIMDLRIYWDEKKASFEFKQAIARARKIICDHNKSLSLFHNALKSPHLYAPAYLATKSSF